MKLCYVIMQLDMDRVEENSRRLQQIFVPICDFSCVSRNNKINRDIHPQLG